MNFVSRRACLVNQNASSSGINRGGILLTPTEREWSEELVDTVDRERVDFIQKYFHVEWPDRAIYHTMINTTIGDDAVVHMILEVMKTLDGRISA